MKNFKIGDKITRVPLIQGGMGVGISLGRLAGSVAKEGGVGIISTAQIGYREEDFDRNPAAANERAIAGENTLKHINACVAHGNPPRGAHLYQALPLVTVVDNRSRR